MTERAFPDLNSRNKPTGRELQPITNQIQKRIKAAFIEPMQCKSVTSLPAGDKWTFEIKVDGYRSVAVKRGREVTLFSRHEKVLTRRFPNVVEMIASLEGDLVLDGELVALDPQGKPFFSYYKAIFRSRFRFIFTYSVYSKEMANCA